MDHILYNKPSKYQSAPYGFTVKVMGANDTFEYWVQCSKNIQEPDWQPVSTLLTSVMEKWFEDEKFIRTLLITKDRKQWVFLKDYFEFNGIDLPDNWDC